MVDSDAPDVSRETITVVETVEPHAPDVSRETIAVDEPAEPNIEREENDRWLRLQSEIENLNQRIQSLMESVSKISPSNEPQNIDPHSESKPPDRKNEDENPAAQTPIRRPKRRVWM